MRPLGLIETARRLAESGSGAPRQSDLKRAISTAYYAVFHALCRNCADCLVGGQGADRSSAAWRQAYRAVEHRFAKDQYKNDNVMSEFPSDIRDFAECFATFQKKRHSADYDPDSRFNRSDVKTTIDAAESVIKKFFDVGVKDRRAFAVWTIMKNRTD